MDSQEDWQSMEPTEINETQDVLQNKIKDPLSSIQIEEEWDFIKSTQEGLLLKEVCSNAHEINEDSFNVQLLNKIKKDLLSNFDTVYSYFCDQLASSLNTSQALEKFHQAVKCLHKIQPTFNFTTAYVLKLCCDYLTPSFHLSIFKMHQNLGKHKRNYAHFLEEYTFDIITAGMIDDEERMESLITGHRISQNWMSNNSFQKKVSNILKDVSKSSATTDDTGKEISYKIKKFNLQMKCDMVSDVWYQIIELQSHYQKNNSSFFDLLEEIRKKSQQLLENSPNSWERLIVKSPSIPLSEIISEISSLSLPDKKKAGIITRILSIKDMMKERNPLQSEPISVNQLSSEQVAYPKGLEQEQFPSLSVENLTSSSPEQLQQIDQQESIKCLCLDGGGIRGIIQLMLLTELENRTGKKSCEMFDFFAGTSIGGIVALSLAAGYSAQTLLFKFVGSTKNHIFSQRHYMRYLLGVNPDGEDSEFNYALYNKEGIETELKEFFLDMKLNELKSNVLVTSCQIQGNEMIPVVFTKLKDQSGMRKISGLHPSKELDSNFKSVYVKDVARSSSAAYPFLAATVINGSGFVDGGFQFNNVDILVTNLLISQGFKKSQIKMLSLGNAPPEIASSMMSLESGRTAALGLLNCVKGLSNPENFYEQYLAMANLNLEHSLAETASALKERYIRLYPEYGGEYISLDAVDAEDIQKLKAIGSNWINACRKNGSFKVIQQVILDKFEWSDPGSEDIQIVPRYYSYKEEYAPLEQAIQENDSKKIKDLLHNFKFKDSQQIIQPLSFVASIKSMFSQPIDCPVNLLCKASAIGHIPSIQYLLSGKTYQEQKEMILKQTLNYWNCLHYASANGEIASFVFLLSILLETDLFFPDKDEKIPKRIQKSIASLQWNEIRNNIKDFVQDKQNTQLPYSNSYAPLFNFHRVDTLNLALENKQLQFYQALNYLLSE